MTSRSASSRGLGIALWSVVLVSLSGRSPWYRFWGPVVVLLRGHSYWYRFLVGGVGIAPEWVAARGPLVWLAGSYPPGGILSPRIPVRGLSFFSSAFAVYIPFRRPLIARAPRPIAPSRPFASSDRPGSGVKGLPSLMESRVTCRGRTRPHKGLLHEGDLRNVGLPVGSWDARVPWRGLGGRGEGGEGGGEGSGRQGRIS